MQSVPNLPEHESEPVHEPPPVATRALMSDGTYSGSDIASSAFTGGSYVAEAYGFHTAFGESRDASDAVKNDMSRLYDYALAADTFTGNLTTGNATMTGSGGYTITAKKFRDNVAEGGVNDTALLKDSVFADWLQVDGDNHRARLFNKVNLNTAFQVDDFATVRAQLGNPANTTQPANKRKIDSAPTGWSMAYDPDNAHWNAPSDANDPQWWQLPWLQ